MKRRVVVGLILSTLLFFGILAAGVFLAGAAHVHEILLPTQTPGMVTFTATHDRAHGDELIARFSHGAQVNATAHLLSVPQDQRAAERVLDNGSVSFNVTNMPRLFRLQAVLEDDEHTSLGTYVYLAHTRIIQATTMPDLLRQIAQETAA